jgi:hypothetical protein
MLIFIVNNSRVKVTIIRHSSGRALRQTGIVTSFSAIDRIMNIAVSIVSSVEYTAKFSI